MELTTLFSRVDSLRKDMIELLVEMVSVPTVSPSGEKYGEFVDKTKGLLSKYGLPVNVIQVPQEFVDQKCPPEARGNPRYIIETRLDGKGGILDFNGHYDVVPGGPGWTVTEPFKPLVREGKIYGRGTVDMKGGIVSALASMIALKEEGVTPRFTVRLYMVPDEEIGGECGTGWLVENLREKPDLVIIPEPSTTSKVWHGHKGALWVEISVKGKTAHASTPWLGVNAYEKASRLTVWLTENYLPKVFSKLSEYRYDIEGADRATAMIGGVAGIRGGGKVNQVPGEAYFSIDRRIIPEESVSEALHELREYLDKASRELSVEYDLRIIHEMEPALTPPDSLAVKLVAESAEKLGIKVEPTICMGGLDLHYYTRKGIPAASYGPGNQTPHAPNEYVEIEELVKAAKVFAVMIS